MIRVRSGGAPSVAQDHDHGGARRSSAAMESGKARLVVNGPQGGRPQGSTSRLSTAALAAAMKET
ncbi:hypothetical protein ACU4GR_06755 [Methylobacterium oryzae CBMB20]